MHSTIKIYKGSSIHAWKEHRNAMTYVRHYGKPDLFIPFTCNPKWKKIEGELFLPQIAKDRSDLLDRFFQQKLENLIDLIKNMRNILPRKVWQIHTWVAKTRVLHVHILFWMTTEIHTYEIERITRQSFDIHRKTRFYGIVKTDMVHDPCGRGFKLNSQCLKNNVSSKNYPKRFLK